MRIDYDAALLIVQSSEARQYGDLVSRTGLLKTFGNYVLLRIASGRCVYVGGRCGCVSRR